MVSRGATWVVVLIKDFATAKQRLGPALNPIERQELAWANAILALEAAQAGDRVLAVCGSPAAAELAAQAGAEVLLEEEQQGQNQAAQRGITRVLAEGATSMLLLSSDLPYVTRSEIQNMLVAAEALDRPAALAAPANGRGGTNALFLNPPDALGLHFGQDSLAQFQRDAAERKVSFALHESPALAIDLDEPADLVTKL
jgi:2-phospho-L-lactate guanylyltransferase